jgi:hypothetical protein
LCNLVLFCDDVIECVSWISQAGFGEGHISCVEGGLFEEEMAWSSVSAWQPVSKMIG